MISIFLTDRLGRKIKVFCEQDDTIEDLKKVVALQLHTQPTKLRIQRGSAEYKNHITLADYEVTDGQCLELFYN